MDGNPAGWYDDPDDGGTKRYWDGTAWTDDTAPAWTAVTSASSEPFDPLGEGPEPGAGPAPAPGGAWPAGRGRAASSGRGRGLWIALAVAGVVVVIAIVALAAVVLGGDDPDHTFAVEQNVPVALERNYADQGLEVTVSSITCGEITTGDGPFSTTCTVGFRGTDRTLEAIVTGSIDGDAATIDNAVSESNLLDEALALEPIQTLVDQRIQGLTVTSCTLPETPLVMRDGDELTCELSNGQTVTATVEGASVRLTAVS